MSMDRILNADKKPYVSPVVVLRDFRDAASKSWDDMQNLFENSRSSAASAKTESETNNAMDTAFHTLLRANGVNDAVINEACDAVSGPHNEFNTTAPIFDIQRHIPIKNSKLKATQLFYRYHKRSNDVNFKFKATYRCKSKYFNYRPDFIQKTYRNFENTPDNNDIIMTVHVCPSSHLTEGKRASKMKTTLRFLVRGDMPLAKLRDKIFCPYDYFSNLEDNEPATDPSAYYCNRFPSSFLFIHDTFYVDKRNEKTIDISEPIRTFMKNRSDFDEHRVADITDHKIVDLKLRLGQPYVFRHIGDCEHIFFFTDLRLLHITDSHVVDDYPMYVSDTTPQTPCCVCNKKSMFVVTESDRIPQNPAFMCADCFRSFHYIGEVRVGSFKAFHYIEAAPLE